MPINVAKLAVTAGLYAANMALNMTRTTDGPRLDDLEFTNGDYNAPLPLIWGTRWTQGAIFFAEDLTEVKRRRKTKGGKFNEYTYYGTWAVAVAGHPTDAVTRIKADTHLVYDITGAGPVMPFDFGTNRVGTPSSEYITFYNGDESQEPDPRMQATIEAIHGVGSCPAYRGISYVIFKDIPLEKFGNRIPQMSFEVVNNSSSVFPAETFDAEITPPSNLQGLGFSPNFSTLVWSFTGRYEVWDTASRTRIAAGDWPETMHGNETVGVTSEGAIIAINNARDYIYRFSPDGLSFTELAGPFASGEGMDGIQVLIDGDGAEHWLAYPFTLNTTYIVDGTVYSTADVTGTAWQVLNYFTDDDGNIWAYGNATGSNTTAHFLRVVTVDAGGIPEYFTVGGLPSGGGPGGAAARNGKFILHWEVNSGSDKLYLIDPATATIDDDVDVSLDTFNSRKQWIFLPPGAETIWLNTQEYSLLDLSLVRDIDLADWGLGSDGVIYDPVNVALFVVGSAGATEINWAYLDRVGGAGVTLQSVMNDVSNWCGISAYDYSDLDQTIEGWSAVRGNAANMVEPLLDAYDSDIGPSDFTILGQKRTGATGGSLATGDYVAREPRYSVTHIPATQLPRSVTFGYADLDSEQQPNNVLSTLPFDTTDARGEDSLDLSTLALTPNTARGLGDRYFRRIWNSRREAELGLTRQELALEPGVVRTLDFDGQSWDGRLTRQTIGVNGEISTEWVYDNPALASVETTVGADFAGWTDSAITIPAPSRGFIEDIPLIRDTDDGSSPVLYTAAGPYNAGFRGAVIYGGLDFGEELTSIPSSGAATWGYATDTLGDADAGLWDRGNTVNINAIHGTLAGATEDEIKADPRLNLALLGGELIQFTTATLEGDGTYTLSNFLRGRRGTEWATGTHNDRDIFLLMDGTETVPVELGDVGTQQQYKTITVGRTDGFIETIDFQGASLKPYAPANVIATKQGNGDILITWTRRTRIGAGWGTVDTPLGEATEAYELDLGDGSTTVTKTATTNEYTWTQADQISDTGAEVFDPEVRVYQMSAAVGRGF